MKVAVFSESSADEAALRILIEALRGHPVELAPASPRRRANGVDFVLGTIGVVWRYLLYQTDVDLLALVVDSNEKPVHADRHDPAAGDGVACRLCRVREVIKRTESRATRPPGRRPHITAVGLAVPAIEAWLLCGHDPHYSEVAWAQGMRERRLPFTKASLKERLYGTDRPALQLEAQRMKEAAVRIRDGQLLPRLERDFPGGFGTFAQTIRNWLSPSA